MVGKPVNPSRTPNGAGHAIGGGVTGESREGGVWQCEGHKEGMGPEGQESLPLMSHRGRGSSSDV